MTVSVGIIGTGGIAEKGHALAFPYVPDAKLAAVLSREADKARDFLVSHNAPGGKVHTLLDEFVADPDIDCVIVTSPDRLHATHALACLQAGKDVLLEKPMTVSVAEAETLIRAAETHRRILAVGFHLRSHLGHRALFDSITQDHSIGDICHIRALWAFPNKDDSNWRAGTDLGKWWSLAAVGSHCFDLVRWFAGDMADWKSFNATIGRQIWNGPHDETAVIAAQLQTGPTVEVVSSVQFGPADRLEIYGDKGAAICSGTFGRHGGGEITVNGDKLDFVKQSPFIGQLQQFVDCVRTRQPPRVNAVAGLRSVRDLLLAYDC